MHRRIRNIILMTISAVIVLPNHAAAQATSSSREKPAADTQRNFAAGEHALAAGDLGGAEREFRKVLAADPNSAGAYANLGVIYMRRKQWQEARTFLTKARGLAPRVPGIRLNIGLSYYRQGNYTAAIPHFAAVLRDQPDSSQARYLLGLCYFFNSRWVEASDTLQPLWAEQSLNLTYLYVLDIAAHNAGRTQLDQRTYARMVEIGQDTPEFHLLIGKAHLNRGEYDAAIAEFEQAAQGDSKLPFLHYSLGIAYMHKQDYERAAREFQQDIALEPDVAYNYDRLGVIYAMQQNDREAEKNFRLALQMDARLPSSQFGLGKIYLKQGKYVQALVALDAAEKLAPDDYNIHAVRGRVLQKSGQVQKARAEFAIYTRMSNAARAKQEKELNGEMLNPELAGKPE